MYYLRALNNSRYYNTRQTKKYCHVLAYLEKPKYRDSREKPKHVECLHCISRGRQHRSPHFLPFPFRFDTTRLEKHHSLAPSVPPVHSNSPWPSPPTTPALQQPPLRQPHSPFTLFLSKILERGEGGCVPRSFFPLFPLSPHHYPSSLSTPNSTRGLSSLGLLEKVEVTHLQLRLLSRSGRNKKLRKKWKRDGRDLTW